ncbi:hypothetical protein [Aureispira anguillae]|uniref:Uncharacterized protein n=1 Tax=Aureispira anguillae TaxID=2864201 RepID=A0A915YM05_9BACT|nr:hypothetical protein [Aureispira anguillae]BDS15695.1 hypothetical protein AsAng_0064790 [Aureispira anguillae]
MIFHLFPDCYTRLWVKYAIIKASEIVKGKRYNKVTSDSVTEEKVTLGFKIDQGNGKKLQFDLSGISESKLDELIPFYLEITKDKTQLELSNLIAKYDEKNLQWIHIDVLKEIKKKLK